MTDDYVERLRAMLDSNPDRFLSTEEGDLLSALAELEQLRAQVADFPEQLADAREMALDKLVEAFGEGWDNCRLHLDGEAQRGRGIAVGQYSNQLPWPQYAAPQQPERATKERA